MQPLSHVKPNAVSQWGSHISISTRPEVAVKIAECIALWSQVETTLGVFLALLLHANEQAAAAMYSSVENRAAQLRMIDGSARSVLPQDHYDVISVLFSSKIRPAMKERDRLAHWCWGVSDDLPDALLMTHPSSNLLSSITATKTPYEDKDVPEISLDTGEIFVVTASDLQRVLERFQEANQLLRSATGSVWVKNSPKQRASILRRLSMTPALRSSLDRLNAGRQKNLATQPPSPQPNQSDESQ